MTAADLPRFFAREAAIYRLADMVAANAAKGRVYSRRRDAALRGWEARR